MRPATNKSETGKRDARLLMDVVSTLSLFTRTTMLRWLPPLVEAVELTGERYMVLFELGLQPDASLKELAEGLGVSPSALSVMVQSLVERELVTRVADATDRRKVVLRLSGDGERTLLRLEEELVDRFHDYLQELDPADRRDLAASSRAMLDVVNRILRRDGSREEA